MARKHRKRGKGPKEAGDDVANVGNNIVTFATIGTGLYVLSTVFQVEFQKFLFMVFIIGTFMMVIKPGFNPKWSEKIPDNLTEEQKDIIRCTVSLCYLQFIFFIPAFVSSRNELGNEKDPGRFHLTIFLEYLQLIKKQLSKIFTGFLAFDFKRCASMCFVFVFVHKI